MIVRIIIGYYDISDILPATTKKNKLKNHFSQSLHFKYISDQSNEEILRQKNVSLFFEKTWEKLIIFKDLNSLIIDE
jgi:hypothetical protein